MTDQPKRRYMDWDDMPDQAPTSSKSEPSFSENVVIMPEPHSERWYALWAVSAVSTGGEFYGTRQEAIDWARARCSNIRIWSATLRDLIQLTPES